MNVLGDFDDVLGPYEEEVEETEEAEEGEEAVETVAGPPFCWGSSRSHPQRPGREPNQASNAGWLASTL